MKNLILFLMLFQAVTGLSQTFNYADHAGHEITFGSVCINSTSYYLILSNKIQYCCTDEIWLVAKNNQGAELWRNHIATGPRMTRCRLAVSADKALLVSAGTDYAGCDIKKPLTQVKRVDTAGVVEWAQTHRRTYINLSTQQDGSFHLISLDSLFHCSALGQVTASVSLGLPLNVKAQSATMLLNGQVLINYISVTGPRFRVNTASGSNVKDISTSTGIDIIRQAADSSFVCLVTNNLQRYSKNLGMLNNSSAALSSAFTTSAFDLRSDTIFVAGETANQSPVFYLLDTAFNILHQGISNVEGVKCTGVSVNNKNKVILVCYGKTALPQAYCFSGYFQTGFNGNLDAKYDVGVKSTHILSDRYFSGGGTYSNIEINAAVTVQNFGTDTIYSFHLTDHEMMISNSYCFLGLHKSYQQKIAPGDSVTVQTGTYVTAVLPATAPENVTFTLCLSTSVPNQSNDIELSNDPACIPVQVTRVGLNEFSSEARIRIFPNPSSGVAQIESSEPMLELAIFSHTGQQIESYHPASNQFVIGCNGLGKGIYTLKIVTQKGIAIKRLLVQ